MIKGLGLPYMGLKRKLASKIINHILKHNPNTQYIYDLFGGGGAVSFYVLQHHKVKKVYYNEYNTAITELLKYIGKNGTTKELYTFINKEEFEKHKNGTDWFAGLCQVVWSFGSNQRDYIYGKSIEYDKRLLHNIVVNDDTNSLKIFNEKFNTNIKMDDEKSLFGEESINQKRLRVKSYLTNHNKRNDVNHLERLFHLERLEQIKRIQHLDNLTIINKSYENVEINTPIHNTIIYLDPPYEDTSKYKNDICHNKLYDYIDRSLYKIYMSSYVGRNLKEVASFTHTSTISATANKTVTERLFTNSVLNLK